MPRSRHEDNHIQRSTYERPRASYDRALRIERERRSARRRRMTLVTIAICIVVVIACVGIVYAAGTSSKASADDAAQTASQDGAGAQSQADGASSDSSADDVSDTVPTDTQTTQTTQTVADRSDFAVDPGKTDWNMHSTEEKIVYLTFDDGPSYNTQKVLDILDAHGCKATFFVTDINPDYIGMIKTCYDDGMTIGLHTYSHDYSQVYSSSDAYYEDLDAIGQVVSDQIGYVPCFIRFPGGSSNTVSADYTDGIMSFLSEDVLTRGYQYWDWNLSCGDGAEHTADELVYYATEDDPEASNFTNIVMLMHDADGKDTTVEALPRIIEYYQAKGYTFKALDRDSFVSHQGINN